MEENKCIILLSTMQQKQHSKSIEKNIFGILKLNNLILLDTTEYFSPSKHKYAYKLKYHLFLSTKHSNKLRSIYKFVPTMIKFSVQIQIFILKNHIES